MGAWPGGGGEAYKCYFLFKFRMRFGATALRIMALNRTTFSRTRVSIMGLIVTFYINDI